jgi:4-amino-4-deoxy-L-arabinose transferase-like glycosyltransferase
MAMSFFGIVFIAMAVGSLLILGPGLVSAVVAHRKGYRPWFWILSSGLVGLLVTVLMPGLGKADTPEQRERWETRADWTGGILSACTFMLMFVFPVIGALFFVSVSAPMAGPAIPIPPTMAPLITVEEPMDAEMLEVVPSADQPTLDGKRE